MKGFQLAITAMVVPTRDGNTRAPVPSPYFLQRTG